MIFEIFMEFLLNFLCASLGAYLSDWFILKNNPPEHKTNLIVGIIVGAFFTFFYYFSK